VKTTGSAAQESALTGLIRRSVDRAVARTVPLPPPENGYRVIRGERIPMRDGAELVADHFIPVTATPRGTILIRASYGRGYPLPQFFGQPYAARGLHVIVQSVRGTYGSAGVFEPAINETNDGIDTVGWLREQPWFDGRLATIGGSYLALAQWALLQEPPPELKAAVIIMGPHDDSAAWTTGSFTLQDCLSWSQGMAHQNEAGPLRRRFQALLAREEKDDGETPAVPLDAAARAVLGDGAPWYESWLKHPDRDDPYWTPRRFTAALDRSQVPVLLINGWQDAFFDQTLEQYRRLRERDVEVALMVGPWTHARLLRQGIATFASEALQWLTTHLEDDPPPRRRERVQIFVTGHGWLTLTDWPPAMAERSLYLQPGGALGEAPPPADAEPSTFTFDPADPTPTVGGRVMAPVGTQSDDVALAERADVLTFTGDPLPEDLYVIGRPVFKLVHSADNPHVDIFIRLVELDAAGLPTNVSDGFRRLPRAEPETTTVTIELDAMAHRFRAGSRLRVLIAGGCYPRFAANPGTGEPLATACRLVPAAHRIHHGTGGACALVLPASDRPPTPESAPKP
jgi:putative CocE/NonD family hydrolase